MLLLTSIFADTDGVISVGSAGHERRIINVANGRIVAGSTDAINGGQLFGAMEYLNDKLTNMGDCRNQTR